MSKRPELRSQISMKEVNQKPARAIVAAVHVSGVSNPEFDASLAELRQFAKTLRFEIASTFTQKRARFDPAAQFGRGRCDELLWS